MEAWKPLKGRKKKKKKKCMSIWTIKEKHTAIEYILYIHIRSQLKLLDVVF